MKKAIVVLGVMCFLIGGASSPAQGQEAKAAFSLNLGVQTNLNRHSSFDNAVFTLDLRVGVSAGRVLEISPEIMAAVDDSLDFDAVGLYPGLLLNLRFGGFFIGAGAILPIVVYDGGSDSGRVSPKINLGYRAGRLNLTAYFIAWNEEFVDLFDLNQIGATIGFRF